LAVENFLFFNYKASNILIITYNTDLNIIKENRCIYNDDTFNYCPTFFYQMFTIHVLHNAYYLPLIYCFLLDKISVNYGKSFSALCDHLNPEVVFVDFEEHIIVCITNTWPSVNIKGCRFHLDQSWWRLIHSSGLLQNLRTKILESEER
jgi:hypothetical protein